MVMGALLRVPSRRMPAHAPPPEIADALALLGKRRVVLAVHDASFPDAPGEALGRGSPYSAGGRGFAAFARRLGFNGLQLGPQGQTSRVNASPYDGTLFSRSPLSLDLAGLARGEPAPGLLSRDTVAALVAGNPRPDGCRVPYRHVFDRAEGVLAEIHARFAAGRERGDAALVRLGEDLAAFRAREGDWLVPDALYETLCELHGNVHWRHWPRRGGGWGDGSLYAAPPPARPACAARRGELQIRYRERLERYALAQYLLELQHRRLRRSLAAWDMVLLGDVQVGFSPRDAWRWQSLLLADYRLGAPPSRTNPAGQAWGHGVLDPARYHAPDGAPGPVRAFLVRRIRRMLTDFDGLRIDHPHGLVCPWVYRADDPEPDTAVRMGARLFASPDLPDHPGLARYAIARRDQLSPDPATPRHADDWVRSLEPAQVDAYAALLDTVMEVARAHGRNTEDILCEVLSTQPYPLERVMARHDLGRFRVTQKARLDDPRDVYRSENAQPADWMMVGNHDTPPVWQLARQWHGTAAGREQAEYLARRLRPGGDCADLVATLAAHPEALVHAKVADLFASPARNVLLFFPDLLGLEETYNRPGTVSAENWSLRVPPDYAAWYPEAARQGRALNLPRVLALALRPPGAEAASAG